MPELKKMRIRNFDTDPIDVKSIKYKRKFLFYRLWDFLYHSKDVVAEILKQSLKSALNFAFNNI